MYDPNAAVLTTHRLEAYMDEGRPMLNNYTRHAKIGDGQHGEVYLCYKVDQHYPHGHPARRTAVAMKSVRRNNLRAEQMKRLRKQRYPNSPHLPVVDNLNTTEAKIRKEIAIMKKLRHPNVVHLFEVIDDRMKDKIYMIIEYLAGGEVKWRDVNNCPVLTLAQTRRIMRDAVLGLEYLHHQGIIHRDIKPANLLWTEDRQQVKIADFGVSHFSYAQRLAAAGNGAVLDDPQDPILLDDSDLTRRAGTPSFLAPEIIFEHTNTSEGDEYALGSFLSTTAPTVNQPNEFRHRPAITKAIDVWALGVTLYCLLFGRTPFTATADSAAGVSEWSLYNSICNNDWPVDETMGFDKVRTGGRVPGREDHEGKGALALLDRFLKKDVEERITLEQVKYHPWILKGLADAKRWLQVTSPAQIIRVSVDEASDAMSTVHFRWNWGAVSRRISSLLRTVRPQRLPLVREAEEGVKVQRGATIANENGLGTARALLSTNSSMRILRQRSAHEIYSGDTRFSGGTKKEKEKAEHEKGRQRTSGTCVRKCERRSKSTERWSAARSSPKSVPRGLASASPSTLVFPSAHTLGTCAASPLQQPACTTPASFTSASFAPSASASLSSPTGPIISPSSVHSKTRRSESCLQDTDRPRTRFALFVSSIVGWRPNKYSLTSPSASSPLEPEGSPALGAGLGGKRRRGLSMGRRVTRRSEEALRYYRGTKGVVGLAADGAVGGGVTERDVLLLGSEMGRRCDAHGELGMNEDRCATANGRAGMTNGGEPGAGSMSGILTASRRASSWGQGDVPPAEFAEVVSVASAVSVARKMNEQAMIVGAGGVLEGYSVGSAAAGLDTGAFGSAGASDFSHREDVIGDVKEERNQCEVEAASVLEVERAYGAACFDDDSSTLASGMLRQGSDLECGDDIQVLHTSDLHNHDHDDGGDDALFEYDSDEQDNAVTFSPKKRALSSGLTSPISPYSME